MCVEWSGGSCVMGLEVFVVRCGWDECSTEVLWFPVQHPRQTMRRALGRGGLRRGAALSWGVALSHTRILVIGGVEQSNGRPGVGVWLRQV